MHIIIKEPQVWVKEADIIMLSHLEEGALVENAYEDQQASYDHSRMKCVNPKTGTYLHRAHKVLILGEHRALAIVTSARCPSHFGSLILVMCGC